MAGKYSETKQWKMLVQKVTDMVVGILEDPSAPDWDEILVEFSEAVEDKIAQI